MQPYTHTKTSITSVERDFRHHKHYSCSKSEELGNSSPSSERGGLAVQTRCYGGGFSGWAV